MAVKQISVFLQNRSGGLADITDVLAKANVNIRALSISESSDFGVLRLIVDDVFAAGNALKENGHIYSLTDVIAVAGEDKPGSIAKIVSVLAQAGMSLDYAYAFFAKSQERAIMIIKVEDRAAAKKVLKENGIPLVNEEEIAKL
ncbi:MAG: ACT domain-containing protein [Lachnospiraceae bacterium]|nr:ACT domain-containing protein [Lachnospiraceae bacterium]